MIKNYTTIDQVRQFIIKHYEKYHSRRPFCRVLSEIQRNNMMKERPEPVFHKQAHLLSEEQFKKIIDMIPVEAGRILSNPNNEIISEEYSIPAKRDVAGFVHLPYIDDHMHVHNHFEINYVYSGTARQQIDKEERVLKIGELCIIAPNMHHNVLVDDEESLVISLMVRKSTFDVIFGSLLIQNDLLAIFFRNTLYKENQSNYLLFKADSQDEEIKKLIQDIMIESNGIQKYANVYVNCLVQQLFYVLLRQYSSTVLFYGEDKLLDDQNNFSMILAYVQNHYRTATLKSVASFFNYSETYLSRLFRRNMHETFNKTIQNLKMKKAEEYLLNTNMSIAQISEEVGYSSADYFTKNFKRLYGCTPSDYRKLN